MDDSVTAYLAQFLRDKLIEHDVIVDYDYWYPVPKAEQIFMWLKEFEESHV
jgi:DNA primase large subunit